MSDLRDALKKAGLVDDKRARKIAHEEKARKNRLGKKGAAEERRRREEERLARERARREEDRKREAARRAEEERRQRLFQLAQLIRDHALTDGVRGNRRFHFVTRDRKIPFLEVSEEIARRLEHGQAAICEVPDSVPEEFVLVDAATARRVRETAPEYVLFFHDS